MASGRWSDAEHAAFEQGLQLYSSNWKRIQALVPTRTLVQIRTHAQKYFLRHGPAPQAGGARSEGSERGSERGSKKGRGSGGGVRGSGGGVGGGVESGSPAAGGSGIGSGDGSGDDGAAAAGGGGGAAAPPGSYESLAASQAAAQAQMMQAHAEQHEQLVQAQRSHTMAQVRAQAAAGAGAAGGGGGLGAPPFGATSGAAMWAPPAASLMATLRHVALEPASPLEPLGIVFRAHGPSLLVAGFSPVASPELGGAPTLCVSQESDLVLVGDTLLGVAGLPVHGLGVHTLLCVIAAARAFTKGGFVVLHLCDVALDTTRGQLLEEVASQLASAARQLMGGHANVLAAHDAIVRALVALPVGAHAAHLVHAEQLTQPETVRQVLNLLRTRHGVRAASSFSPAETRTSAHSGCGHAHHSECTPRCLSTRTSSSNGANRGVVYVKPGVTAVRSIAYPKLELPEQKRKCQHGVILKVVATNICGSDQHMVRGRTTAPEGLVLGHEITGEVVETGRDVEFIKTGDVVSTPFNIACGRCANCKAGHTGICLTVNPARPGAAYGYVDMGGWVGGQAEYVMVPYADFNLLKLGSRDAALAKIMDLTMLSDILPTGFHGCVTAGVGPGSTVYIAGGGPVGLAAAASAQLLGAAAIIVGDLNPDRLAHARACGFETVDISKGPLVDQIHALLGVPEVDCAVDAVGFEARGCGSAAAKEVPAQVLNDCMTVTKAGGAVGIPGLYVTEDPGAVDAAAKLGNLSIRLGLGWAKSLSFFTGQCPVMKYHRKLAAAIMHDKIKIAKAVNATLISLDDAPKAYQEFDKGVARKFVIDPHGTVAAALGVKHATL